MSSVQIATKCGRFGLLGLRLTGHCRRAQCLFGSKWNYQTAASSKRQLSLYQHNGQTFLQCFPPTSTRKFNTDAEPFPKPFVAAPYSYAYGRSRQQMEYKTLGAYLEDWARDEPDRTAIIVYHEGIKKTVAEFNADVNRMANYLYEKVNVRRGDVVGLWSCNSYNWVVIEYAITRIGAILCTVNPYYKSPELEHVLRMGDIKVLFLPGHGSKQEIANDFIPKLTEALASEDKTGMEPILLKHVITLDGTPLNQKDIPPNRAVQIHTLDEQDDCSTEIDPEITRQVLPDDPAIIMFTSGTTGKPKGAFMSHNSITNDTRLSSRHLCMHDNPLACVPIPFFHAFAGIIGAVGMTTGRLPIMVPYFKHNIPQLVEAISETGATHLMGTPTIVIDVLHHLQKTNSTLPSLQSVLSGGASMPVEIANQFVEQVKTCTGFQIGYGATETGPCSTTCNPTHSFEKRTTTVGAPLDFIEIRVVNKETKRLVKLGEAGEVHTRGFNLMMGYWKEPEKTRECLDASGWYNTGDLGSMDEDGFLKIHGRSKELIIVGGENVHPLEVEELLHTHPEVANAYVVGVPDPRKGEAICAWVELANSNANVSEEDLRKFCKEKITYFKVPTYFLFITEFPMTSTGKVQKFKMREISIEKLNLKK